MEAFVTRKKRRLSPTSPPPANVNFPTGAADDSTELKLALLSSLQPDVPQDVLLDALLHNDGDVERTSVSLSGASPPPALKRCRSVVYQSSLSTVLGGDQKTGSSKLIKNLTRKGKTLHLFSPEDVEQHTPCSIIHNFLPQETADALLAELVEEAPTYWKGEFQLFDRTVESPHTFAFYVENEAQVTAQKTEYYYNGMSVPDVRPLLPEMRRVSRMVEDVVNKEISRRTRDFYPNAEKLRYQSPHRWTPNAAFVNCYDGPAESVGYHTDELTYLGPRAVIGSLSLGVAREFRVRKIVPREAQNAIDRSDAIAVAEDRLAADTQGQIAIHLPHNSLLVMHSSMQEEWKHSIAPATSVEPHPLAGNKRLNVTYRHYRDCMHPRYTPRCNCGVPVALRCVMKTEKNRGRYMWMCHMNFKPGEKGCGYFKWAKFTDNGEPIWE